MQPLEDSLVEDRWVTREQLQTAQEESRRRNRPLWPMLVKLGFLSEEEVFIFLAQSTDIVHVTVSDYEIDPQLLNLLPEDFCRQNLVLPLFRINDVLFMACANPLDTMLVDNLSKMSGSVVEPLLASAAAITHALDVSFGPQDKAFDIAQFLVRKTPLQGVAFRRESERIDLRIPVHLIINDPHIKLRHASPIECYTRDISVSGTAMSLISYLFLPKGVNLFLEFPPHMIKAEGQIIHCHMIKGHRYCLGIKFFNLEKEGLYKLLALSGTSTQSA